MRRLFTPLVALATAVVMLFASGQAMAQTEVTLWTHWAAEKIKRDFVEDAIRRFEEKNPGVKIKASWYEKTALYAALKTALRAGQAPDIFYAEPDQVEYMENGFLLDLSDLNWQNIEPWAKDAWSYKGKPYGFPLEASTVELYYNKKMVDELGVKVPDSVQLSPDAFLDLVKKAKAKGMDADGAWRRRPSLPGRLPHPRGAARRSSARRTTTSCSGASCRGPTRASSTRCKWLRTVIDAGLLADELHEPQARRGAHLLPHQSRRRHVPERQLVHLARLQPARQGRPAEGLPARHHEVPGGARRRLQRVPDAGGAAASTSPTPRRSTRRR